MKTLIEEKEKKPSQSLSWWSGIKKTKITREMAMCANQLQNSPHFKVTKKEAECFYLMLRGNTYRGIADFLSISHRTVENHMTALKKRLHCRTRNEVIRLLLEEL